MEHYQRFLWHPYVFQRHVIRVNSLCQPFLLGSTVKLRGVSSSNLSFPRIHHPARRGAILLEKRDALLWLRVCVVSHRIHVWYIYLHWLKFMVNVGKHTRHGSYGFVSRGRVFVFVFLFENHVSCNLAISQVVHTSRGRQEHTCRNPMDS